MKQAFEIAQGTRKQYVVSLLDSDIPRAYERVKNWISSSASATCIDEGTRSSRDHANSLGVLLATNNKVQGIVFNFLCMDSATAMRATATTFKQAVAAHVWDIAKPPVWSIPRGKLPLWSKCFPHSTTVSLQGTFSPTDGQYLRNIKCLHIQNCSNLSAFSEALPNAGPC
jgi:hypothetical protein